MKKMKKSLFIDLEYKKKELELMLYFLKKKVILLTKIKLIINYFIASLFKQFLFLFKFYKNNKIIIKNKDFSKMQIILKIWLFPLFLIVFKTVTPH